MTRYGMRGALLAAVLLVAGATPALAQNGYFAQVQGPYTSRGPVMYGRLTYYGALPAYSGFYMGLNRYSPGFVSNFTTAHAPVYEAPIHYSPVYDTALYGDAPDMLRSSPLFRTERSAPLTYVEPVSRRLRLFTPGANAIPAEDVPPGSPTTSYDVAHVFVRVPENAKLWFQGSFMPQTGAYREFVTPDLPINRDFTYDVRAEWVQDGRPIVQQRKVTVRAGERTVVDFLEVPAPRELPTPTRPTPTEIRTKPLPPQPLPPIGGTTIGPSSGEGKPSMRTRQKPPLPPD